MNDFGVNKVISYDLGKLREVPSIPFLQTHHIVVNLFIEIVQQSDGLDDHGVNLFGREFELETRETMS